MTFFVIASVSAVASDQGPVWDVAQRKSSTTLRVSDEPDGRTLPAEFDGRACRRTDVENGSAYMYVHVDDAFTPPREVFVTVEFFDQSGMLSVQFDAGEGMSAYSPAPEAYGQSGAKAWRRETFTLRHAEFKNRQNGGADFRLHADGRLAVSRIELSTEPPEGFEPSPDPAAYFEDRAPVRVPDGMTVIQQWQIHEPVPPAQLADSAYIAAKQAGITSLQSYVGWAQLEPRRGELDYSLYDPVVAQIRNHDLKWLPFLITAPYIATPEWFREESGVDSVCLEHGESTPIQSIWNSDLRAGVRRFIEAFAAHYPANDIEALNLGISGNWGESIVVAGGGFGMAGQHSHLGWWCGDEYARADLRRWVEKRYGSVDALNAAWNTNYTQLGDVEPFIPLEAPSRRAAVDLFAWYTQSMTDYAEFWVKTARELYPDLPIYLCTGGHGQPELAADFAAQARMCARYGAGIRITNQSDDAPGNFAVTRMVSSATRLYGGYYTTEPGGANTPKGIACRVFDAVSGGACGVYFKTLIEPPDRLSPTAVKFAENAEYLVSNAPALTVGALMPNSSLALDPKVIGRFIERTQALRDALEFEIVDENMIADGLLTRFRALMVIAGDTVEGLVLDALRGWVEDGGVLFMPAELGPMRDVEDQPAAWWPDPADAAVDPRITQRGAGYIVTLPGQWPEWRDSFASLLLASGGDVPWQRPLSANIDGAFDGVLGTRVGDRLYYYNNGDAAVEKEIPGVDARSIPGRSIVSVPVPAAQ